MVAGLSSRELTLAHYLRLLANEWQSKANDQWSYFQAKRIRGTNMEMTADLLRPPGEFRPDTLSASAVRLQQDLRRAEVQIPRP